MVKKNFIKLAFLAGVLHVDSRIDEADKFPIVARYS